MDVKNAIEKRRAYRSIEQVEITQDMIRDLATSASLAPSCYNNQPWRFVFVKSRSVLPKVFDALPKGNAWSKKASMIVAVYSLKELDCSIGDRTYYLFDTGMSVGFLMLRATEMGLVAHPIAGFDPEKVRNTIGLPDGSTLIALIVVGRHSDNINNDLSEWQREQESQRPPRKPFDEFCRIV